MIYRRYSLNENVYFVLYLKDGDIPVGGADVIADVFKPDGSVIENIPSVERFKPGLYVFEFNQTDIKGFYFVKFKTSGFKDMASWFMVV